VNSTVNEDRKFYVSPNRIIDADMIGEVEYFPDGTPNGNGAPDGSDQLRKQSEIRFRFKDRERGSFTLMGEAADKAWLNFRTVSGPDRISLQWDKA
jgi:hypothetical protein